jgi:peptide/nickel transport system substrate-binding protein
MRTRKSAIGLLAAGVAAMLLASGCGSSSPSAKTSARAQTLIFDMDQGKPGSTTNFNPYGDNGGNGLVQAVYEPLFITNVATGELEPWLAESLDHDSDYKTWTVKLRAGITWSDGQAFTAQDVVYTLGLVKDAKVGLSTDLSEVTATATDPRTVTLTVTKPDPLLGIRLFDTALQSTTLVVLPEHIWSTQKDITTFTNFDLKKGWPVGTGPYQLTAVTPNTFTYKERGDYWGAKAGFQSLPAPKTLQWTALGTESTRASAMASGDLDVGAQFSTGTYQSLVGRDQGIQTWEKNTPYGQPDVCGYSLDFNTLKAPWSDPQLRWAVNYAIDRSKLVSVAFSGASKAMLTPFPDFPAINEIVSGLTGDAKAGYDKAGTFSLEKSQELFQAAGYTKDGSGTYAKNGKKLSLVVNNFDAAPKNAVTAALVEQLRQAGIDATQNKMTVPNFVDAEMAGNFAANVFFGSCGSTTNPWASLDRFNVSHFEPAGTKISGFYANPFRWDTPAAKQYSQLVDELAQVDPSDSSKVQDLVSQALGIWYQELPMVPLLNNYEINPVSNRYWTNWPTADNAYVWGLYVSASVQKLLHTIKPAK